MSDKEEAYPGDGLEIALNPSTPELNKALAKFQKKHHFWIPITNEKLKNILDDNLQILE